MRIAILDDYADIALRLADWSPVLSHADVTVFREALYPRQDMEQAIAALQPFDILCTVRERSILPGALLTRLPRLKLITVIGDQLTSIDTVTASACGIKVWNARGSTQDRAITQNATPELAWGLVLATMRHIPRQDQTLRASGWQTMPGTILYGKTMGILGLGQLGTRVAHYAKAFGMEVIAWSKNLTPERATAAGATYVDRATLFARSDVLSIHLRLSERSRGLVDATALRSMKPGAVLINTSRGQIIDEAALIAALQQGWIAGAGLDVFDQEPLPEGHPLRALDQVVLTPHLGYFTQETMAAFYQGTVQAVSAFLDGRSSPF